VGVALLALPGVVPALKWWRRRRRLSAERVSERYAGAWLELVDQARDLGRPVPVGLTRPAEARALERGATLAAEADVKIFGPGARSGRGGGLLGAGPRRAGRAGGGLPPLAAAPGGAQPRVPPESPEITGHTT
jgi:hypothetical protein